MIKLVSKEKDTFYFVLLMVHFLVFFEVRQFWTSRMKVGKGVDGKMKSEHVSRRFNARSLARYIHHIVDNLTVW